MYVIYAINKNSTYNFSMTDLLNFEHTRKQNTAKAVAGARGRENCCTFH